MGNQERSPPPAVANGRCRASSKRGLRLRTKTNWLAESIHLHGHTDIFTDLQGLIKHDYKANRRQKTFFSFLDCFYRNMKLSFMKDFIVSVKKAIREFMELARFAPVPSAHEQPSSRSSYYSASFAQDIASDAAAVKYFDQSIRLHSYGSSIDHWDQDIQNFWRKYVDRYYEYFVLAPKIKRGHVLDIGAEFYNKYIKEVLAKGQILAIVDVKEPSDPDIEIIQDLDSYYKFDMTSDEWSNVPSLSRACDTVLSFGVLGYYNFTAEMCVNYLDNMVGFLKPDGLAVIKVDLHVLNSNKSFPPFSALHQLISDRFRVVELDILTDHNQEYYIYYCELKAETK